MMSHKAKICGLNFFPYIISLSYWKHVLMGEWGNRIILLRVSEKEGEIDVRVHWSTHQQLQTQYK